MPVGTAGGEVGRGGAREEQGEGKVATQSTTTTTAAAAAATTTTIMRTLDGGEAAGDEFAREAADYETLLGKIDKLLERLGLDA